MFFGIAGAFLASEKVSVEGKSVLVIDDNESARLIIEDMLIAMSLKVAAEESAEKGLQAIIDADKQGAPFDMVFVDWHMPPGMNGIEFVKALKKLGYKVWDNRNVSYEKYNN